MGTVAALTMATVAWLVWDSTAAVAALGFGALATAIQLFAARLVRRLGAAATIDHPVSYGVGMVLRVIGVILIWVAVTVDRTAFPPGAAAAGYLGTLLPLMWLETRLK